MNLCLVLILTPSHVLSARQTVQSIDGDESVKGFYSYLSLFRKGNKSKVSTRILCCKSIKLPSLPVQVTGLLPPSTSSIGSFLSFLAPIFNQLQKSWGITHHYSPPP